jgi:hypothetical protein
MNNMNIMNKRSNRKGNSNSISNSNSIFPRHHRHNNSNRRDRSYVNTLIATLMILSSFLWVLYLYYPPVTIQYYDSPVSVSGADAIPKQLSLPIDDNKVITTASTTTTTATTGNSNGNYKIIGFADYNFRDVALKWYQRLEDLGYREHVIIAYDHKMDEYLESLNKLTNATDKANSNANATDTTTTAKNNYFYRFEKHILPPLPEKFITLSYVQKKRKHHEIMFAWRWHYILDQLQAGTSILLTDVDNIFNQHVVINVTNIDPASSQSQQQQRNSQNYNNDFADFDVIHAYEHKNPPQVFAKMGFTVCGGMSWLKSSQSTIAFVSKLIEKCGTMCDDQIILNEMIASQEALGIQWDDDIGHDHNDTTNTSITNGTTSSSDQEKKTPVLPRKSRTGRSSVTGHRIKIWDRDWVFRGDPSEPLKCHEEAVGSSSEQPTNWIAMPFVYQDTPKVRQIYTRQSAHLYKLAMFDIWDEGCGALNNKTNTNDTTNTNTNTTTTK